MPFGGQAWKLKDKVFESESGPYSYACIMSVRPKHPHLAAIRKGAKKVLKTVGHVLAVHPPPIKEGQKKEEQRVIDRSAERYALLERYDSEYETLCGLTRMKKD